MTIHCRYVITAAALLLASAGGAAHAQERDDTPTTCPDTRTQLGMNICAQRAYLAADAELNAIWPTVMAHMRVRDRDFETDRGEGRPGYQQALRSAQRAWISWRDAQCVVEGYAARGGSMEPMLIAQCKERLTRERIEQLTMIVEDRD